MATRISPFTLRVLVVDACSSVRASSLVLLALWGHEGRAARDGASGLTAARRFRPHVILADLSPPGMDGCRFARRLRSVRGLRRILLVALAARCGAAGRRRAREAGFDDVIIKAGGLPEIRALLAACADDV
jgi:two-component system OmpR family response regulator